MASIAINKEVWGNNIFWEKNLNEGEKWSGGWGSSLAQFIVTIYPRICEYMGNGNILEIAPGYGRWTKFLIEFYEHYQGVDLNLNCVNHCKSKFSSISNCFFINDGYTLPMINENTIDFVFSYDSLVHADFDVMKSYLQEIKRVLKVGGYAFIHHSNLYEVTFEEECNSHMRSHNVNARVIMNYCKDINLKIVSQEVLNWDSKENNLIDCYTIIQNAEFDNNMNFITSNVNIEREYAKNFSGTIYNEIFKNLKKNKEKK